MPPMSLAELCAVAETVIARSEATWQSSFKERLLDTLMNTKLGYSSQYGSELTRSSILNLYSSNLEPQTSNLLLTSGASEAIFLVMSTLFEAGDTIIVQQPIYQSLYQVAADRGVKVIDWNLCHCEESGSSTSQSHWDIAELKSLIKTNPEAKALVINNPNNPTGLGFNAEELKQISTILEDRILISDEVFLFISQSQLTSAIEHHHNSIVISDLSKSFNLPGLRLGWIITNCHPERSVRTSQSPLSTMSSLKNYLSLRTNTLSEALTPLVLELAPELTRCNRELIKNNIEQLYSQEQEVFDLSQITKDTIEGLTIFPLVKNPNLVNKLWQEEQIFLAKGENFGANWVNYTRLSLVKIGQKPVFAQDKTCYTKTNVSTQ